jgi:hypothetical protein
VAGGVIVPPRLSRTIQLVRGDGDTLLASIHSEVKLGLDFPQPVVGIERLVRVADGGGLQADEPLDFFVRSSPGGASRFPPLPRCSMASAILCIS